MARQATATGWPASRGSSVATSTVAPRGTRRSRLPAGSRKTAVRGSSSVWNGRGRCHLTRVHRSRPSRRIPAVFSAAMAEARVYTKTGDDGTTGLFFGGRRRKDNAQVEAYGTVDEAVAAL